MKEKIKNFFTNKTLWEYIIGFFVLIILLSVSYSKGFIDGVLIDDDIRTELIDTTLNETKKNNIVSDKKEIIENNPPWSVVPTEFYLGSIAIPWARTVYTAGDDAAIHYVSWNYTVGVFADMDGENIIIDYVNLNLSYDVYVTGLGGSSLFRSYRSADIFSFDFDFNINKYDNDTFYLPLIMAQIDSSTGDVLASFGLLNSQRQLIVDTKTLYPENTIFSEITAFVESSYSSAVSDLNSTYGISDTDYPFNFIDMYFNLDQNNTYICPYFLPFSNNIFNSNVVKTWGTFVETGATEEQLQIAFNNGVEKGKEIRDKEYLESQSFFDNVWSFIEKATSKTLDIFSMQILPGIPLYFLILIPIAIGLIGWVFKLLQR